MSTTEIWIIAAIAVIAAAIAGFAIGRRKAPGGQDEVLKMKQEYDQLLEEKQAELARYQKHVHQHYNQTAVLFKDMAGSYKKLFDHLSVGSEQLGDLSDQRILPERAGALLDGPDTEIAKETNFINPNYKGDEDALNR
ncbi:MAG: DUF1043 family protein [Gammaproteobacteria bacterium]|nr:DUF1043 family protein [Gammaproteobacteria bacterium]